MNVSCHHHHGPKASYSMGSNHMHQWRLWRHKASSRHLQAASSSNKLHLHHLGSTTSNRLHLHHHNQSNHQGTIISSPRLHEHHLQASIWLYHVVTTARVTIRWVGSTQLLLSSSTIIKLVFASMTIYSNSIHITLRGLHMLYGLAFFIFLLLEVLLPQICCLPCS